MILFVMITYIHATLSNACYIYYLGFANSFALAEGSHLILINFEQQMFSDLPANKILMNHREVEEQEEKQKTEEIKKIEEKASKFSSGIYIVSA